MRVSTFGKIVKSLRSELIDYESGRSWNRKKLAAEANLSERVIGNIERGDRVKLTNEEIMRLADALHLSTMERIRFFSAAHEIENVRVLSPKDEQSSPLDYAWQLLQTSQLPAYIIDPFFNLVGMTHTIMTFYGWTDSSIEEAVETKIGGNLLYRMFSNQGILRRSVDHRWDAIACSYLNLFRFTTLRHRHLDYFESLLARLSEHDEFTRLWRQSRLNQGNFFSQIHEIRYTHERFGSVAYAPTTAMTVADQGELYTISHIPLDASTADLYRCLNQREHGARIILPWPCWKS